MCAYTNAKPEFCCVISEPTNFRQGLQVSEPRMALGLLEADLYAKSHQTQRKPLLFTHRRYMTRPQTKQQVCYSSASSLQIQKGFVVTMTGPYSGEKKKIH